MAPISAAHINNFYGDLVIRWADYPTTNWSVTLHYTNGLLSNKVAKQLRQTVIVYTDRQTDRSFICTQQTYTQQNQRENIH